MKIFYIDLFSGAGGTSTGIHLCDEDVKVVACVNHDLNAIESHKANHPDSIHLVEDIRDFKVVLALQKLVKSLRRDYPSCVICIWASLECTNYSKAKGGLPRDGDSRTLGNSLFMKWDAIKKKHYKGDSYIQLLKPDYLFIENVREFMSWGPLDKDGKPISRSNGRDYIKWKENIQSLGYDFDYQMLNAADFGAFTSRERYFAQFALSGLPIRWPEQTHSKKPKDGLFEPLKKWKAVKEVLDMWDDGESIFTRKKDLVEKTLERIYAGLIKFVAGGETAFLKKYYSGRPKGKVISVNGPAGSITTVDHHHLVQPCFLTAHYSSGGQISDINNPCPTVSTKDRFSKVEAKFLTHYYSSGGGTSDINKPAPVITSNPKARLTVCKFVDQQYGCSKPLSVEVPCNTVTQNSKFNLVDVKWMLDPNYKNVGTSLESPSPTILACRKHHYLVNPQYNNKGGDIDKPCFTLIARMDKKPPYLVSVDTGVGIILIYDDDTPWMIKIKEFMAAYGIVDIKMRMLKIIELLRIMGFPEDYVLKGTKTEQKKYIGNAVVTIMAEAIVSANAIALISRKEIAV